jgi:hypothetical protein
VGSGASAADVMVGIGVDTIVRSISALTTAILYFDLVARYRVRTGSPAPEFG